jgi:hypothetical protein
VYIGSAEIQHSDDDRVFEREKRDTDTSVDSGGNERIYEQEFLELGILREYGRTERTTVERLYQESGRS